MAKGTVMRFVVLLLVCLSTGCSQWYFDMGEQLVEASVPDPESGVSLQEVLDEFGPPLRISASTSGYKMAWEHWYVEEEAIGFNLGLLGVDVLNVDYGVIDLTGTYVLMTFDRDHQLTSSNYTHRVTRAGVGKSIQPFAEVVDVLDTDDLTLPLPQHEWGALMLSPLTETINYQSSPYSGQSGLEQRGTPIDIGQRTLELN